jgi:hypothetical protein
MAVWTVRSFRRRVHGPLILRRLLNEEQVCDGLSVLVLAFYEIYMMSPT